MNRRHFIAALAALGALPARALPGAHVGLLIGGTEAQFRRRLEALRTQVKAPLIVRAAGGDPTRLAALAQDLVAASPAVLVADSMVAARMLFEATPSIPIVMARSENPVGARLVRSLEQPGGNVTGIVTGRPDALIQATNHLARLLAPGAPIAALLNQNNQTYRAVRARVNFAANELKREQVFLDASLPRHLERAFAELATHKGAGLLVMDDPMFLDEAARIVQLAAKARRPAIYPDRAFVQAGGLMSYGADAESAMKLAGQYVARVLAGENPAGMALREVPAFELHVNRATARAQGIKIPAV